MGKGATRPEVQNLPACRVYRRFQPDTPVNMLSALYNPEPVQKYLQTEMRLAAQMTVTCNGRLTHTYFLDSRLAPKIFSAISDTLEWIFVNVACQAAFTTLTTPHSRHSRLMSHNLQLILSVCTYVHTLHVFLFLYKESKAEKACTWLGMWLLYIIKVALSI